MTPEANTVGPAQGKLIIESDTLRPNSQCEIYFYLEIDSSLGAMTIPLEIYGTEAFARVDSVKFIGVLTDPTILNKRVIDLQRVRAGSPDTVLIECINLYGRNLPSFSKGRFMVWYVTTGGRYGSLVIDSTRVRMSTLYFFVTGVLMYKPQFTKGVFLVDYLRGEVTQNEVVDILDILWLSDRLWIRVEEVPREFIPYADVDCDGYVTPTDIIALIQVIFFDYTPVLCRRK